MGLTNVTLMLPVPALRSRQRSSPKRRAHAGKRGKRRITKRASSVIAALLVAGPFQCCRRIQLPYRPIRAERLQGDFDQRAGIQTQGLDPPPRAVEEQCLNRAWHAFTTRVATLKDAFGQLVDSTVSDGLWLWQSLRQSFDSAAKLLCFLSEHHRISLLGDYRCLRPDG